MIDTTKIISKKAESNINKIAEGLKSHGKLEEYDLLVLLVKYMVDLYRFEVNNYQENKSIPQMWSPVNKIDNLNRDFFVLCHD